LLGAYRSSDVDDPKVFMMNTVAVLMRYSEEIVRAVCDPGSGIQVHSKWLPTVSEIREACEKAAGEFANRERRRQLNEHRVLLDTPWGAKPEREGLALLQSPDAQRRLTDEERAALAERVKREVRAAAEAQRRGDEPPREDVPPPELADPDAQKLWYEDRLEVLRKRYATEPTPKLSAAILATNAGRPWGAPDITLGPAPAHREAAE
jgi:hypothetical protein